MSDKQAAIEDLDRQIAEEESEWIMMGLNANVTVHTPEHIWRLELQLQALINVLILTGLVEQEDLSIQYKKLMLQDMRDIRAQAEAQKEANNG